MRTPAIGLLVFLFVVQLHAQQPAKPAAPGAELATLPVQLQTFKGDFNGDEEAPRGPRWGGV